MAAVIVKSGRFITPPPLILPLPAIVAVRSSATAEDSKGASFAGQLETFLGIRGEASVIKSVQECWGSLYSKRV